MKFLIVGPGAMGCLFGARLKRSGFDVTLLDYLPERAEKINKQGIDIEGVTGSYHVNIPVLTGSLNIQPDIAVICVKSDKTRKAAMTLNPLITPDTLIVTLQNGVGNIEILGEIFGKKRVMGGVTSEGANMVGLGKIRHAGQGTTVIGPSGPAEKIVSAFNRAGFRTEASDDVESLIWGKLIINVGINALTALTGLKNGLLPRHKGTRLIMEDAVREAMEVVEAKGIRLPFSDPLARVIEVCEATSENRASMLQDVTNKKTTEIDFINGAIVREGRRLSIPVPVNHTLTSLIYAIQSTYDERIDFQPPGNC